MPVREAVFFQAIERRFGAGGTVAMVSFPAVDI